MDNTPEGWYRGLPIVTRGIFTAMFITTCLVQMGLLNPMLVILDWRLVYEKFNIWRIFTSVLFLGKFSFNFVMQLYFFTSFGSKLERSDRFSAMPGDYAYFAVVVTFLIAVLSIFLNYPSGLPLLGSSFIFAIIYYWSRIEPNAQLSFFGFVIQGYQFPFALMLFTMLMGGDIWMDVLGLGAAHIYYFLRDVVPMEYGRDYLKTPEFMNKLMVRAGAGQPGAAANYQRQAQMRQQRDMRFTGEGHRLG
ncbi:ER-associated protein degradation protein [Perkinsus olseni]|uniref:Derlin n=2 Tax=Perkinsus olseni TaxID=32597 RepID=A0A7J6RQ51_PEROL|nr:ER-associated protein degradation protein [Perkinsus olseni]